MRTRSIGFGEIYVTNAAGGPIGSISKLAIGFMMLQRLTILRLERSDIGLSDPIPLVHA